MNKPPDTLTALLGLDGPPPGGRIVDEHVLRLRRDFIDGFKGREEAPGLEDPQRLSFQLSLHIVDQIRRQLATIKKFHETRTDFVHAYSRADDESLRQQEILRFARQLGARARELRGDRKALKRWFGLDSVNARCERRISEAEYWMSFCLNRLGVMMREGLRGRDDSADQQRFWQRVGIEKLVLDLLEYRGDSRVRTGAFHCLVNALSALNPDLRETSLEPGTLAFIYRSALESSEDVWIQTEALSVLELLSPDSLVKALVKRLGAPRDGDDIFARRRAVFLLFRNLTLDSECPAMVQRVIRDPSPFVRQAVAWAAGATDHPDALQCLRQLASHDESGPVRAAAILKLGILPPTVSNNQFVSDLFNHILASERDDFVLRVVFRATTDRINLLMDKDASDEAAVFYQSLAAAIEHLHQNASSLPIRRFAALTREACFVATDPEARRLAEKLSNHLDGLMPGRSRTIPSNWVEESDENLWGRVLAYLGQNDYGYTLGRTWGRFHLTRGDVYRFRWWRFLFESLHPSTEKRQAFDHCRGRHFAGHLHAPSAILAELSQTKVPGEPFFIASEAGWRPYLPLVDEMCSSASNLSSGRPWRRYTAEGITEIVPPASWLKRWRASLLLTWRFPRYAAMRNWQDTSDPAGAGSEESANTDQEGARQYVEALESLGFRFRFHGYPSGSQAATEDPTVQRFFGLRCGLMPLAQLPATEWWLNFKRYFFSAYGNSLTELAAFTVLLGCVFAGRIAFLGIAVRKARQRIPLSIGGWGTRGKSGTERLKAAVFEALGHGTLSKSTGCEAMFMHAFPFGKTREMFLFRPYDKATIWEHHSLIRLTPRLGARVFLWECMGLTPSYVQILQERWSRDDIATITNTYPDHEDLQGPAGINIPEVMGNFIPKNSRLITTEEEMLPVLKQSAIAKNTPVHAVGWLEAGLLTEDVLRRFPYQEHPNNIALILGLCEQLGIPKDYALKEMADRVIADLGVLKAFPVARIEQRRLEFINGMSANERFGCLGNWHRMNLHRHDPETEPGQMISTVINNRADRVPRSRVFASIIVNDIHCDKHFLIGSNLNGMQGYIREEWDQFIRDTRLWPHPETPTAEALRNLERLAKRLRIPTKPEMVRARLEHILDAMRKSDSTDSDTATDKDGNRNGDPAANLWDQPEVLSAQLSGPGWNLNETAFSRWYADYLGAFQRFISLRERVESAGANQEMRDAVTKEITDQATEWFFAKIIVIDDFHASGDEIIRIIIDHTPAGTLHRIMGMQNIKGTGLDFVYRWKAWEQCHEACRQCRSDDSTEAAAGLRSLVGFQDFGWLCAEETRETLEQMRDAPAAQTQQAQADLTLIRRRLDEAMAGLGKSTSAGTATGNYWGPVCDFVESFLDTGDAVRRRKKANRIYKDMVTERISHERAALELQSLNKRQKGGWLRQWILANLQKETGREKTP